MQQGNEFRSFYVWALHKKQIYKAGPEESEKTGLL